MSDVKDNARSAIVRFANKATTDPYCIFTPDDICRVIDGEDMEDEFFDVLFKVFPLNRDFTYREVVSGLTNIMLQVEESKCPR